MDGVHDLGGMHGFGRIDHDPTERGFHAPWEAEVVAMMNAVLAGTANIDEFRHAIERMEPARYLGVTYFEKWLDGITRVLIEKGVITADELDARTGTVLAAGAEPDAAAGTTRRSVPQATPRAGNSAAAPRTGASEAAAPGTARREPTAQTFFREAVTPPRFTPGDRVVTRNDHPAGHTRLPRYARGKRGTIAACYGTQVFPDTNAHGLGEQPQPLYRVAFEARDLWGESAEPNHLVTIDLWESYLLPGDGS